MRIMLATDRLEERTGGGRVPQGASVSAVDNAADHRRRDAAGLRARQSADPGVHAHGPRRGARHRRRGEGRAGAVAALPSRPTSPWVTRRRRSSASPRVGKQICSCSEPAGFGLVKRFLLGSVSLAVARHARCPVLVVKGRPRKLGSVLVAMDGSEDSFQAVRFLQSLALPRQTKVRLLSVVEQLRYPSSAPQSVHGQIVRMLKELEAERRGELEKVLERAAAHLDDKVTRVTRSTRHRQPGRRDRGDCATTTTPTSSSSGPAAWEEWRGSCSVPCPRGCYVTPDARS